jgi:hypothetical protein
MAIKPRVTIVPITIKTFSKGKQLDETSVGVIITNWKCCSSTIIMPLRIQHLQTHSKFLEAKIFFANP